MGKKEPDLKNPVVNWAFSPLNMLLSPVFFMIWGMALLILREGRHLEQEAASIFGVLQYFGVH